MFEKDITVPRPVWKLSGLFRELQELSGEAAAQWNASGIELMKLGLMWVVVRYEVGLARSFVPGEVLHAQTWALPVRHGMSQRNYLLLDGSGSPVLTGAGIWGIVDRRTRKLTEPEKYGLRFGTEVSEAVIPRPGTPAKLPLQGSCRYTVTEADLDINGHMNNTRYFDLAEEQIPPEGNRADLFKIRAVFMNEARLGEEITLSWGSDAAAGSRYFCGTKNGADCFQLGLTNH